jgi:thiol-disulfide isomerase/thioredoxin
MNKKVLLIISIIVGVIVIGGVFAYVSSQNDKKEQDKMAMEKKAEDDAMMKKEESASMEKDAMEKEGDAMSSHGSYVTLAEFTADPSKYADTTNVYFFHASWCPICQGIDKEITAVTSAIPAGVTLIKTDFDSSTSLRQKYGVTTQYTFVQVDTNGNETAQWSATSLEDALAGIES